MPGAAHASATDPLVRAGLLCGVVAPVLYAGTVIWGASLFPGYSHIADPISSLTETGRSGGGGVQSLLVIYNVLVLEFAFTGLSLAFGRREWTWSFVLLLITALAGLLMWPFTQDPIGTPATTTGIVHVVLAAIASLGSMGTIGFAALAWRRGPDGGRLAVFSLLCLAIVFASGAAAGIGAATGWRLMGLFERITIGTFQLWLLAVAVVFIAGGAAGNSSALVDARARD